MFSKASVRPYRALNPKHSEGCGKKAYRFRIHKAFFKRYIQGAPKRTASPDSVFSIMSGIFICACMHTYSVYVYIRVSLSLIYIYIYIR